MTRFILGLVTVVVFWGCTQPEKLGTASPLDPRRSARATFQLTPLSPIILRSHADYDRWEDEVISRSGATLAYMLYKESLVRKRGTQRTFVRWMVLAYRDDLGREFRAPLHKFVEGLAASGDDMSDDVRYLIGYIAWKKLTGGGAGPELPASLRQPALIDTVIQNWETLADRSPDYVGPRAVKASELKARVVALRSSLEAVGTTPPKGPVATPSSLGGWTVAQVDALRAQAGVKAPTDGRDKALESLSEFQATFEDKGVKKGCEHVDAALRAHPDNLLLGDAVAQCALARDKPRRAIAQLSRMVATYTKGGIGVLMSHLAAYDDPAVAKDLAALRLAVQTAAEADPMWAARCGITASP